MRTREVRGFLSSDWRTQCFVGCIMCHPGGWCWGPFLYPDQNNLVSHGLKGLGKEEGMTHAGQQPLGSAFLYLAIAGIVSMQQHGTPLFTGFYGTRMNTGADGCMTSTFPAEPGPFVFRWYWVSGLRLNFCWKTWTWGYCVSLKVSLRSGVQVYHLRVILCGHSSSSVVCNPEGMSNHVRGILCGHSSSSVVCNPEGMSNHFRGILCGHSFPPLWFAITTVWLCVYQFRLILLGYSSLLLWWWWCFGFAGDGTQGLP